MPQANISRPFRAKIFIYINPGAMPQAGISRPFRAKIFIYINPGAMPQANISRPSWAFSSSSGKLNPKYIFHYIRFYIFGENS